MSKTKTCKTWCFNFKQLEELDQKDCMLLYREMTGETAQNEDSHFLSIMELAALIAHQLIKFEILDDHKMIGKVDAIVQASPHLLSHFSLKNRTIILEHQKTIFFPSPITENHNFVLEMPKRLFLVEIMKDYDFYM